MGDGGEMLTLADKEGKGIQANADIGWQRGVGGLANADITDKNPAYGRQSISRPMRIVAPMP